MNTNTTVKDILAQEMIEKYLFVSTINTVTTKKQNRFVTRISYSCLSNDNKIKPSHLIGPPSQELLGPSQVSMALAGTRWYPSLQVYFAVVEDAYGGPVGRGGE